MINDHNPINIKRPAVNLHKNNFTKNQHKNNINNININNMIEPTQYQTTTATTMPTATIYYTNFPSSIAKADDDDSGNTIEISSPNSVIVTLPITNSFEPVCIGRPAKMLRRNSETEWKCPVSAKASQTITSSVQNTIQPIVEKIKLGIHRKDGKNPLSLAVSTDTTTRTK
jgi:hypothetical protein